MTRKCFISAPAGIDLSTLRSCLSVQGYAPFTTQDIAPGESWLDVLRRNLAKADIAVFVLDPKLASENVSFELGFAAALFKPILLIAPPSLRPLPSDLAGIFTVRASIDNAEAIGFALQQLSAAPKSPARKIRRIRTSMALHEKADIFLNRLDSLKHGAQMEELVQDILCAVGVDVVTQPAMSGGLRPDFAVWSDELQAYVGNPLIVEVKLKVPDLGALIRAIHQVTRFLSETSSRWGLLLYAEGPASDKSLAPPRGGPTVLALPLRELIQALRDRPFSEVIRDLRNQRVHGVDA